MWLRLLDQAAFRALTGGVLYALLVMSVDQIARLAERSVRSRDLGDWRVRHRGLWARIAQIVASAAAIGFIFALLVEGSFAANDVGIVAIDWPTHGPWLAVLIPGTIALIIFFWAPYFSRLGHSATTRYGQAAKGPEILSTRALQTYDEAATLLNALTNEASLTVFRAASIPLLGSYWGVWFGLVWSFVVRSVNQRQRPAPMTPDRRGFNYLAGALDWLSATIFVVTGSVWACLLGRLACHAVAQVMYHWSIGRRLNLAASVDEAISPGAAASSSEAAPLSQAFPNSGEDEGQDDQRGEHDRSQDGDALQVT